MVSITVLQDRNRLWEDMIVYQTVACPTDSGTDGSTETLSHPTGGWVESAGGSPDLLSVWRPPEDHRLELLALDPNRDLGEGV